MPWTPRYTAHFLAPVAANLLAAVVTNQAAALRWANDDEPLPSFKAIFNSAYGRHIAELPALMLTDASTVEVDRPDEFAGIVHRLNFELYVSEPVGKNFNATATAAQEKVYKYVRAVDSIWRSMTGAEITEGMTSNPGVARVHSINHRYAVQGEAKGVAYVNAARLEVEVRIIER